MRMVSIYWGGRDCCNRYVFKRFGRGIMMDEADSPRNFLLPANKETIMPIPMELEPGNYLWCSCGKSKKSPLCDGAHKGTECKPYKFTVTTKNARYSAIAGTQISRHFATVLTIFINRNGAVLMLRGVFMYPNLFNNHILSLQLH